MFCLSSSFFLSLFFFFFNDTATTEIYTLSLHDALPICHVALLGDAQERHGDAHARHQAVDQRAALVERSEEHTSELQSLAYLVCRLLLEKKKKKTKNSKRRDTEKWKME